MFSKKKFGIGNPVLKEQKFIKARQLHAEDSTEAMTVQGAIDKTLILFGILMVTTMASYLMPSMPILIGGAIGGLVLVIVAVIKPSTSPYTAPLYAAFEGMFVGAISAIYAATYEGIIFQAVGLTFGTLLIMLLIYRSGLIPVTQKFRMGVIMATGAVFFVYLLSFVLGFFGIQVPYIHEGGPMGIGISVVIIGVAALNLLLDFDSFEKGEAHNAPAYMEWFCAMGLLITLVWLYVEFLRLLSKLRD